MSRGLHLRLTPRLTIVFALFAAVLLIFVGVLAYYSGRSALEAATVSALLSEAIEKEAALNEWILERQSDLAMIAASPRIVEYVTSLGNTQVASTEAQTARDRLVAEVQFTTLNESGFLDVFVMHPESGEVMAATDPDMEGIFSESRPFFINGKIGPYVQNPYYSLRLQRPVMTLSLPLHAGDGRLIAVLAGNLDPNDMTDFIARRSGLQQTEDAFLVNAEHLFVTQPHLSGNPLVLQQGIHTEDIKRCLAGNSGVIFAADYRNIPAIIVHRWLPERQLCLIVKMDQAEAIAPVQSFGAVLGVISVVALVVASLLGAGLARTITRPILTLQRGVARFGQGELDVRLPETSRDEIGLLAHEFNVMAATLAEKEKRILERTEHLRTVMESASDAIVTADAAGDISYFNRAAQQLFGYTADTISNKPLTLLMPERFHEAHLNGFARYLATGEAHVVGKTIELVGVNRDGSEFPVDLSLASWEAGDQQFFTAIIRDATERQRVLNELRFAKDRAEAVNKELEAFSYSVSHDLRAPLRSMDGFSQALLEDYGDQLNAQGRLYLERIRAASQNMGQLIDDLLQLARLTRSEMQLEKVNLSELVREIAAELHERQTERLVEFVAQDSLTVTGDARLLRAAMANLLGNAWKFTGMKPQAHIEFGVTEHEGQQAYFVRDDGAGFDMTYANKLFGAFQRLHSTREFEGTGIGLATVQRIIHRHGGRVWAKGAVNAGATFYFTLNAKGRDE